MERNELEGAIGALLNYIELLRGSADDPVPDLHEKNKDLQDTITRQNQTICELSREVLALKKKLEEKIK